MCRRIVFIACLVGGLLTLPVILPAADLPKVNMIIDNYDYMISFFPDDYANRRQALRACSTITAQAESLKTFWDEQSDMVLRYLSRYAGIDWVESDFDIYIVKYYPDYAGHNPMTIPLAGKKNGERIIALPQGKAHLLTLFQQLSRRLLDQLLLPESAGHGLAEHPLMEKTSRRFDNLANLLALRTLSDFVNADTLLAIFRSAHWREREPGQEVFFSYFWDKWSLSEEHPLTEYLAAEPYNSPLVTLTRPPATGPARSDWGNHQLRAPEGGKIGISVIRDRSGFFRIVHIDTLKSAYACGLRRDDLIRNIDATPPQSVKQLFALILDKLPRGAHVNIIRDGKREAVIVYPRGNNSPEK